LRGTDKETVLNISLDSSSPLPLLPPFLTPPPAATGSTWESSDTDDNSGIEYRTSITESDFKQEKWENGHRLNTQDPSWERVFPCIGAEHCHFCKKKPMAEPVVEGYPQEYESCFKLSTFQLVCTKI